MPTKVPKPLGRDARFTLEPGDYWLLSPGAKSTSTWNKYWRILKEENPPGSFQVVETRESPFDDSTWLVINVDAPITVWKSAIPKYGPWHEGLTSENLGLWVQQDPSFIHDASEALDRVGNYGDALGKLSFAIGLAGVGLFLFSMRRK